MSSAVSGQRIGRYLLYEPIAAGGMASVYLGRMLGALGFARTVAIKRLHPHLANDPEFVAMFLDEARLAARIQHPNVVSTLDVVTRAGELFLVMEYVAGDSLSRLMQAARRAGSLISPSIAVAVAAGMLNGLHAAHEARSEDGAPLRIVHRDVSPQNVIVGGDGVARVADFGVAKAVSRLQTTRDGSVKGKLAYMSPEQIRRERVDRRADVYAAGVVTWEMLSGKKMFTAEDAGAVAVAVLEGPGESLRTVRPDIPPALEAAIARALAANPADRYATAAEMAEALGRAHAPASQNEVARWVEEHAGMTIRQRATAIALIETMPVSADETPSDSAAPAMLSRVARAQLAESPTAELPMEVEPRVAEIAPPARRRSWLVFAFAVVALAALGFAERSRFASARPPVIDAPPSAEPSTARSALPISASAPSTSIDSQTPPTPSSVAKPATSTRSVTPRRVIPAADKSGRACDPPYYFDDAGIKRVKPGCM